MQSALALAHLLKDFHLRLLLPWLKCASCGGIGILGSTCAPLRCSLGLLLLTNSLSSQTDCVQGLACVSFTLAELPYCWQNLEQMALCPSE